MSTPQARPHLTSQRLPEKMCTDRAALDELLAATVVAHVSTVIDGRAVTMPTAFAVIDDHLVIHGSTGSRWMRAITDAEVSVTVTRVSGIVVARSMFESSMLYQSAMLFGRFQRVAPERVEAALEQFTDRLLPGRSRETRRSTKKELAATLLLGMPITEWSLRISDGMPEDEDSDIEGDSWAGQIRFDRIQASACAAPDLRAGIEVPPSVSEFLRDPRGII